MQCYKLNIQILSPVHIGSDIELSPFDYVIINKKLHYFKFEKLISKLSQAQLQCYYQYIDCSDVISLRNFVIANFDESRDSIYSIPVTDKIDNKYQSTISNLDNQLLVSPFIHYPLTYQRFLPGSSIKGAIRTAIVDMFAHEKIKPVEPYRKKTKEFEPKALSYIFYENEKYKTKIQKDPFRGIKITDVVIPQGNTLIGEVINARKLKNKNGIDKISIQMIKEVVSGYLNENNLSLNLDLRMEDNQVLRSYFKDYAKFFNVNTIINSCKSFYNIELDREMEFYKDTEIVSTLDKLKNIKLNNNEFLLRLGRFSGVYAVTVNDFRNPKTKSGKFGTSRNLFEGKYPMGWLKCSLSEIK